MGRLNEGEPGTDQAARSNAMDPRQPSQEAQWLLIVEEIRGEIDLIRNILSAVIWETPSTKAEEVDAGSPLLVALRGLRTRLQALRLDIQL